MEHFLKYEINVVKEDATKNYGCYSIQPLQSGFGITIGNALRRIILSNIPGASVFAVKVNDVTREFQSIPNVVEDMTQIILNLKNLIISINENIVSDEKLAETTLERWPTLKINLSRAGVVTAADIECPVGFEIINKNLHICTLTSDKKFNMEIYATRGRGFKTFNENRDLINTISVIPIDSNFSPIVKVSYAVEEVKLSKQSTSDRLVLEVATNGTISAGDAIALASKILVAHLNPLIDINQSLHELQVMREKNEELRNQTLSIPIENLDLTVRSYNCLKRHGIQTIQELTEKPRAEIEKIRNLGKKSLREINKKLLEYGLKLKG
ncbi:DNA-directed RNA polymerase subunit alpha [Mycoplasmoides pirum]|uniref:DNA-directed RNA polymerase subunit alpha n=1 Tax=Mycoplasmoides pirum TaxID=2122 RepID=UPI00047F4266|nr:DNA-directed RNA polymerase subunit alpha [Mycoplasmoides pirum]